MYTHFGLTLMVNHACNLRCTYCYTGAKTNRPTPLEVGFAAIDRALATLQPAGTLELGFFGGEPLFEASRITRWIQHARDGAARQNAGLRFNLTTNGTHISGDRTFTATNGFYVLGDDSKDSQDSRFEGTIAPQKILGRAWCVVWPISRMRWVNP